MRIKISVVTLFCMVLFSGISYSQTLDEALATRAKYLGYIDMVLANDSRFPSIIVNQFYQQKLAYESVAGSTDVTTINSINVIVSGLVAPYIGNFFPYDGPVQFLTFDWLTASGQIVNLSISVLVCVFGLALSIWAIFWLYRRFKELTV